MWGSIVMSHCDQLGQIIFDFIIYNSTFQVIYENNYVAI